MMAIIDNTDNEQLFPNGATKQINGDNSIKELANLLKTFVSEVEPSALEHDASVLRKELISMTRWHYSGQALASNPAGVTDKLLDTKINNLSNALQGIIPRLQNFDKQLKASSDKIARDFATPISNAVSKAQMGMAQLLQPFTTESGNRDDKRRIEQIAYLKNIRQSEREIDTQARQRKIEAQAVFITEKAKRDASRARFDGFVMLDSEGKPIGRSNKSQVTLYRPRNDYPVVYNGGKNTRVAYTGGTGLAVYNGGRGTGLAVYNGAGGRGNGGGGYNRSYYDVEGDDQRALAQAQKRSKQIQIAEMAIGGATNIANAYFGYENYLSAQQISAYNTNLSAPFSSTNQQLLDADYAIGMKQYHNTGSSIGSIAGTIVGGAVGLVAGGAVLQGSVVGGEVGAALGGNIGSYAYNSENQKDQQRNLLQQQIAGITLRSQQLGQAGIVNAGNSFMSAMNGGKLNNRSVQDIMTLNQAQSISAYQLAIGNRTPSDDAMTYLRSGLYDASTASQLGKLSNVYGISNAISQAGGMPDMGQYLSDTRSLASSTKFRGNNASNIGAFLNTASDSYRTAFMNYYSGDRMTAYTQKIIAKSALGIDLDKYYSVAGFAGENRKAQRYNTLAEGDDIGAKALLGLTGISRGDIGRPSASNEGISISKQQAIAPAELLASQTNSLLAKILDIISVYINYHAVGAIDNSPFKPMKKPNSSTTLIQERMVKEN